MKTKNKRKKPAPLSYRQRDYRGGMAAEGLTSCHVTVRETDLLILASCDVTDAAFHLVMQYRSHLETYISRNPLFLSSLIPLASAPLAPPIVKDMLHASSQAGVGPMAAVAGAVAEFVGRDLLKTSTDEIIIENGGDIFISRRQDTTAVIFAGNSPLSNKIGILIPQGMMPLGVCTSSGTVGHSLSFGQADAVTVLAPSTSLADAAATRIGNEIKKKTDMNHALAVAKSLPGLLGVVIVKDDRLGVWGDIQLTPLHS